MKVVFILHTNGIGDHRVYKMTQSLKAAGYNPGVVGVMESGAAETETENGITTTRIKLRFSKYKKRNKLIGGMKFLELSFKAAWRNRKADIWHCNDVEGLMIGMLAKCFRPRLKLVYDAHELESERNNIKKWVRRFYFIYEKMFTRFAHTVITVSPSIEEFYLKHFKIRRHAIIYNCPSLTSFKQSEVLREELKISSDKILFLYSGMLMNGRGVEALLTIFSQLDKEKYHVVFMGKGILESTVKEYASKYGNIHFKPAVPYNRILEYASGADYGVQSVEPVCLSYAYSMPNKLFEYIHAGLPVVCNNLKDSRHLVESHQVGYGLDDLDISSFNKILPHLSRNDKTNMRDRLEKLKNIYCWENEEKKLVSIYNEIRDGKKN